MFHGLVNLTIQPLLFPTLFGSNPSGEAQLRVEVPDSITTWITEAVALSEEKGLGIAVQTELKTFKPFFIDFTLPYHVIRGEQTKIPLTVYNYLAVCVEVPTLFVPAAESLNSLLALKSLKLSTSYSK